MDTTSETRLALLIDADNISPSLTGEIFKMASKLGILETRKAYGMNDRFSSESGWSKVCREYNVCQVPQKSNVAGKNVADIALVIDAMDFLHNSSYGGICIVSSDSDFTALAKRICEGGKAVYGMGEQKTPKSFRDACTKFLKLPQPHKKSVDKPKALSSPKCRRGDAKRGMTKTKSTVAARDEVAADVGKAFKDVVADLRSGRLQVLDKKALCTRLKVSYNVPAQDIDPFINTLQCQRVIKVDSKTGKITLVK